MTDVCVVQTEAGKRVKNQIDRMKGRMLKGQVISVFSFELYAVNCDRHDGPASHVELAISNPKDLTPEGLAHAVAALESALKELKAGMT